MVILIIATFLVLLMLVVLVEMVVLQLFRWGNSRSAFEAALEMNLASGLFVFLFLSLAPRLGFWSMGLGWATSFVIEGLVLLHLKPGISPLNWVMSLIANLASYILLIIPIYLFR